MAGKHPGDQSKNHRSRLRKRYSAGGADSFDDYLLMELLLFEFIPRVDTYPAAHSLIDTFGSIEKVFGASKNELMKISKPIAIRITPPKTVARPANFMPNFLPI